MTMRSDTVSSVVRISDWDAATVECDLCGHSWSFRTPEKALAWIEAHKGVHLANAHWSEEGSDDAD
jgi:hypothetical protein